MSSEVAAAHVVLDAKIAGLTSGLAAADAQMRGFSGRADAGAKKTGAAWTRMGLVMAKGAAVGAAAAAAGFVSAVKTASDFETRLSHLQAVTEASASEMDMMRESALELGASTRFSAREVAEAQVELAKAGMDVSEVLGGSLDASLALAAAGEIELAQASETVVNTMGQFGLAGGDAIHIADALAEAANATTADVDEMAQALENAGPMAKNAGMSFDQTVVALEMLAKSGTKGAEAGTTMRSMLTQLSRPTAKSTEMMEKLGIEFFDAQGNFKDMASVSTMLRKSFAGLTAEQKSNAASTIAGTYGQKALLAIMQGGPRLAREYAKGLKNQGQAAKVAETMNDNLAGKLEQLGGAIETIQIRVGSALIPVISDAAVATANWLDSIGDSEGLADFASGAADALSEFVSVAGDAWSRMQPLLVQLGGFAADSFSSLQSAASGAAPVISTVADLLGDVATAALTVAGPILTAHHAILGIPGVAQAATAALVGLGAAFVTMRVATTGLGIASSVAAFAQLAGTVRSASGAAALAGATFPRMAGLIAGIATPAGLAATGIGLLVGGLTLLASSGGPSFADRLASALRGVESASNAAKGAVTNFNSAVNAMRDADVRVMSAKANLAVAQERLNKMQADGTASAAQLQQAQAGVAQADQEVTNAMRNRSAAQGEVNRKALDGLVGLARLTTATQRAGEMTAQQQAHVEGVGRAMGLNKEQAAEMAKEQAAIAKTGGSASDRMRALRRSIGNATTQMDTSTKSGRIMRDLWMEVVQLDGRGLQRFTGRLQELERQGIPRARAMRDALDEIPDELKLTFEARDRASGPARNVKRNVENIPERHTTILDAVDMASGTIGGVLSYLSSVPTSKTTTLFTKPVHLKGSPTVYETIDMINAQPRSVTKTVAFRPEGTGAIEQAMRAVRPGNVKALRARYAGGSLDPIREAIGGAGGLLIRADLQVDNLPEVLAEAREVGVTVGGEVGKAIAAQRKSLSQTVARSNELVRRVEQIRNLTQQLARAQTEASKARKSKDAPGLRQARQEAQRVAKQIAQAQAAFRKLGGNRSAADALAMFDRSLSKQISKLGERAADLRAKAEEMRAARERAFEAMSTSTLAAFDEDTSRQMESIAERFEDGYRLVGGVFELIPGEMRKAENRISAEADRLQDTLDSKLQAIEETYRVRGKALDEAMRVETDAMSAAYDAQIQAVEQRNQKLTAAEQQLANLREGTAAEDRARATQEAEEALREAVTRRMPEAEIQQRMRAVEDARRAELIAGLEKRAETERAAADAQADAEKAAWEQQREVARRALDDRHEALRSALTDQQETERKAAQDRHDNAVEALNLRAEAERLYWQQQLADEQSQLEARREAERRSLEASLEQWRWGLDSVRSAVGDNHADIIGDLARFSTDMERSGRQLGMDMARGLQDAFPAIRGVAASAAGIMERYLRLRSPAEIGPLASMDDWWKKMGSTLAGGADMRAADALMSHYADPARGGASPPPATGVTTIVVHNNITVEDHTFAGMSREQVRRVAQQLGPALDRRVSARIPAA